MNDTTLTIRRLPAGFEELEPFVSTWGAMTTTERMTVRCEVPFEETRAFYDAMMARAEEAIALIEQYPFDDLPEGVGALSRLVLALAQASIAVEIYGQSRAPNTPYPNSIQLVKGAVPFG